MLEMELDADEVLRTELTNYQDLSHYTYLKGRDRNGVLFCQRDKDTFTYLINVICQDKWGELPSIIVMKNPNNKTYVVWDGNHRVAVAKRYNLLLKAYLIENQSDLNWARGQNKYVMWPNKLDHCLKILVSYCKCSGEESSVLREELLEKNPLKVDLTA
ncbi:MAG: hypothetical protein ABIF40_02090 [archaeon]